MPPGGLGCSSIIRVFDPISDNGGGKTPFNFFPTPVESDVCGFQDRLGRTRGFDCPPSIGSADYPDGTFCFETTPPSCTSDHPAQREARRDSFLRYAE